MQINGQHAESDYQSLLTQLASLDSSFPRYLTTQSSSQHTSGKYQDNIIRFEQEQSLYQKEYDYKILAEQHKVKGTIKQYEQETLESLDEIIQYKTNVFDTIQDTLENKNYDPQTQIELLNKLASRLSDNQPEELEARLALGAIYRTLGKHERALEHYAIAYDLQQGKVDYDADRVEQHEYGISDKKIGTDNIQQCVVVILHDPITKRAALAHVDIYTDTKALEEVINKFPEGTKLDGYLVGGRDRSLQTQEISDNNIKRVLNELSKYSTIEIKASDIGAKGSPSGIVFNPQTAELTHAVPGKIHKTTAARKLLLNLQPELNFAFDLTESDVIRSPKFSIKDKESIIYSYLDTPKIANGHLETWRANIVYDPLAKVTEEIKKKNPEIFKSSIDTFIFNKTNQLLKNSPSYKPTDIFKEMERQVKESNLTLYKKPEEIKKQLLIVKKQLSNIEKYNTPNPNIWIKLTKLLIKDFKGFFTKPKKLQSKDHKNNSSTATKDISKTENTNQYNATNIVKVEPPPNTPQIKNPTSNKSLEK